MRIVLVAGASAFLLVGCNGGTAGPYAELKVLEHPDPFQVFGVDDVIVRGGVNEYYQAGRMTFELDQAQAFDGEFRIVSLTRADTWLESMGYTAGVEVLDSEVSEASAWVQFEANDINLDDNSDTNNNNQQLVVDLELECRRAGDVTMTVRLDGIRRKSGDTDPRETLTVPLTCEASAGTGTGSTGTSGMTVTTTVTPDTDSGTDTDTDSGTTGGGPAVDLDPGTYEGTTNVEQVIIFNVLGNEWFAILAASAFGELLNLTTDTVVEELSTSESAAVGDASNTRGLETIGGIPTVFVGFPGLRRAIWDGEAFAPMSPTAGFLSAARLAMVPATSGASAQVCGASNDGLISCVNATGTDWVEDPTTTTDANWRTDCPGFSIEGLAVDDGWALLQMSTGTVCHGPLGAGNVGTAVPLFVDPEDFECPADSVGSSSICAELESTGTVNIVQWDTPSATPVIVDTIETCDGSTELGGLVAADDGTVSFATACDSSDESHLITVDAGTGALVSHKVHALAGCGGRVAALPTEDRVGVACDGTLEILDVASFADL